MNTGFQLVDGDASELARALIRAIDNGEPYTPQPRGVVTVSTDPPLAGEGA